MSEEEKQENNDLSNQQVKKEVSEKFISSIKKWVDLDDKIKKLREEVKLYTNEKKEVEGNIIIELDKMEEKVINLNDGKLRKSVSKTQAPLKKDHIQKSLFDYIKDEKKSQDIVNNMMKSRQIIERTNLKRTKNKN